MPLDIRKKLDVYTRAFEGIDDPYEVSDKECRRINCNFDIQFQYGEVTFMHFIPLIDFVKPKEGEVFYDLGCGTGKPAFIAALQFPELAVCKGIELLDGLVDLANKIKVRLEEECEHNQI